ncbi:MAG: RNA polymerase-binding protein DksA [Alphaproteobacteria bacterium]|nr:RNA polymerase-binding protein DksA [Rickettsiales bacterium]
MSTNSKFVIKVQSEDVEIPAGYNPLKDNGKYMNKLQLAYFKKILLNWKEELAIKTIETIKNLSQNRIDKRSAEYGDRTDDEVETLTTLRSRDRYRKLMGKIDAAILRIETGKYGYCEQNNEEIGIKRLIARPVATLSIEMQRLHEESEDMKEDAEYQQKIMELDKDGDLKQDD